MELIQHIELGSAQLGIEFTSIPQTYTDLLLVASCRSTRSSGNDDGTNITFNGATTNRSNRTLYGVGSGSGLSFSESVLRGGSIPISTSTANTFGNMSIYIPNYREAAAKSVSVDGVMENNGTYSAQLINAGLWNSSAAITSIYLFSEVANLAAGSSATLYGISRATPLVPKATGGTITYDVANNMILHTFTSSGTFTATQSISNASILVVAGGGGGGGGSTGPRRGGGGAGGYRAFTGQSISVGATTVTVGAGGVTANAAGSGSAFGSLASSGGGWGGGNNGQSGSSGGSGGGGVANVVGSAGNSGGYSPVEGYAGGTGGLYMGGGGGGAGQVGQSPVYDSGGSNTGGAGGNGLTWLNGVTYGGGGGGECNPSFGSQWGPGGAGGGGAGNQNGVANTGGGGGALAAGGSGIVIVRYPA